MTLLLGIATPLLLIAIYVFVAVLPDGGTSVNTQWIAALPLVLIAVMALCVALMLGLRRFVVYSGLLVLADVIVALGDTEPGCGVCWVREPVCACPVS